MDMNWTAPLKDLALQRRRHQQQISFYLQLSAGKYCQEHNCIDILNVPRGFTEHYQRPWALPNCAHRPLGAVPGASASARTPARAGRGLTGNYSGLPPNCKNAYFRNLG